MDIISRQVAAITHRLDKTHQQQVTPIPRRRVIPIHLRQVMTMAAPEDIRPIAAVTYTSEATTEKTAHTLPRIQGAPHIGADNGYVDGEEIRVIGRVFWWSVLD